MARRPSFCADRCRVYTFAGAKHVSGIVPADQVDAGRRGWDHLVQHLDLGYQKFLGDGLHLCFSRLGTIRDPASLWPAHGFSRFGNMDIGAVVQDKSGNCVRSFRGIVWRSNSHLGSLPGDCHQTAHATRSVAGGGRGDCILRVHVLLGRYFELVRAHSLGLGIGAEEIGRIHK